MRTHHGRPPFHSLRAAVVAASIVALAACAHVLGGGQLPSPGILMAAAMALTGLAATAATRLKLTFPAMLVVLGAGQLVLHEIFSAPVGTVSAADPGAPLHHASGGPVAGPGSTAALLDPVQLSADHLHQLDSPASSVMLAAHVLATVAIALLLARGEAALWALAAWLRPLVRLPDAIMPDAATAPAAAAAPAVTTLRPWRNLRQDSRRGPPSAVVLP
ncbi:hypothetical protein [Pseudarthrobacter sp. N5]|uniref:hypothetical protein n=1 Tax=Pseudarthrobacter sp. N5 TaxID=3418416 RepID=UPI003CF63AD6